MAIDTPNGGSALDARALEAIAEKIFRIAQAAEAVALRTVKKVQILCLVGILSAAWLTYYCVQYFQPTLLTGLSIFLVLAVPSALLGISYGKLRNTIGLPQRLLGNLERIKGKTTELQHRLKTAGQANPAIRKGRFSELWQLSKVMLEVKSLGGEASAMASVLGEVLILANPLFAVVMGAAGAIVLLLLLAALGTGLIYVL